jgi:hypothetical protein
MHNLISFNQLAEWKHFEKTLDKFNDEMDLINDYYNCLIECDDNQVTILWNGLKKFLNMRGRIDTPSFFVYN